VDLSGRNNDGVPVGEDIRFTHSSPKLSHSFLRTVRTPSGNDTIPGGVEIEISGSIPPKKTYLSSRH